MQPGLDDELAAVSEFTLLKVEGKQDVLLCSERLNVLDGPDALGPSPENSGRHLRI